MTDQRSARSAVPGRTIYSGCADGEAIVSLAPFPLSGVTFSLTTGSVNWSGHELTGQSVRDKILVLPEIIGFAGGDWALYALSALYQAGPRAILCGDITPFVAAGAILGKIVTIAGLPQEFLRGITNGSRVLVDSSRGVIRTGQSTVFDSPETDHQREFRISEASVRCEFQLTPEESEILDGSQGRAASDCLEFLVQYGKALGADRLITIESVHVAGSGYNTVGDAAIAYLTKLADDGARARVPATLNPIALDLSRWQNVMQMPADLRNKQVQLNRVFEQLGVLPTYSCAPYWTGYVPKFGSNVAWGEHNAVAFANSIIGARTNFESHMATIPAAITGRIPYYGMYLPENRKPRVSIEVTARLRSPVNWRCLGVAAAKKVGAVIPLFHGLCDVPTVSHLRDLCASFGPPWTSAPMLHIQGITPEACSNENAVDDMSRLEQFTISDADLDHVRRELSGNGDEPIDLVALGCPQYSLDEIQNVADRLRSRHVKDGVQLWVWTDAATRAAAERLGLVEVIANAGGAVLADTCGCAACPVGRSGFGFQTVATDSTKSCGFLGRTGLRTYLGTVEECIDAAATGSWSRREP